jgi:predicted permease
MLNDLRLALRSFRLQPGFSTVAILTLSLGIGATTAIFSTVNAVVLRQLPFREPGNLYSLKTAMTDGRITGGAVSALELDRLNNMPDLIEAASGSLRYEGSLVDSAGNPIRAVMQGIAPEFFRLFGVPIAAGRDFTAEELGPSGPFGVIISHRAWKTWFASDPSIIGQSVTIEGGPVPLIGVAGEGFTFPGGTDVWFTIKFPPTSTGHSFDGFVRVKPGVTPEQLRAALEPIGHSLQTEFPAANANRVFATEPLLDSVVGPLGPTLMTILAAAGLLLLVACVNVTSLLLSRGVVRARDVAVRVALGAGRGRVFRQLLTESLVLALAGAAAGLGLAYVGLTFMLRVGARDLPRIDGVTLDPTALLFALGATLVTGLVVGFAPALRLARTDVKSLVNEAGRGGASGPTTHRLLQSLVVAEIAMAVVLSIGAALLVRSFWNLQQTDAGFTPEGRIVFEVSLPVQSYEDWDQIADWYGTLVSRISAVAGVTSVGAVSSAPLGPELDAIVPFWRADQGQPPPDQRPRARRRSVSPDFFKAAGIQLLAGRQFLPSDRRDTPGVAIVDEAFARMYFPENNAIGGRATFRLTPAPVSNPIAITRPMDAEIVGIVRSVHFASLGAEPEPTIYLPLEQITRRQQIVVVATGLSDPSGLIAGVRQAVRDADPTLSLTYYDMGTLVARSLTRERMSMTLVSLFGLAALALAAVGIYGIMAYSVAQRRGEFALRAALGAEPGVIGRLVLAQGRTVGLVGAAIGLGLAALGGRLVESQLFGITAFDPLVFAGMTTLMLLVVVGATLLPAWRASRVNAAAVLRGE